MSTRAQFMFLFALMFSGAAFSASAQDFSNEFFNGNMDPVITKLTALDIIKTEPIIYNYIDYKSNDYLFDDGRKVLVDNIKKLIGAGADINAPGPKGDTVLAFCLRNSFHLRGLAGDMINLGADIRINVKKALDYDMGLFQYLYQAKEYYALAAAVAANTKLPKKNQLPLDKGLSWIAAIQSDDVAAVRKAVVAKQAVEEAVTRLAVSFKAQKVFAFLCALNNGNKLTIATEQLPAVLSDADLRKSYIDADIRNLRNPEDWSSFNRDDLQSVVDHLPPQIPYPEVFLVTGQVNLFLLAADPSDLNPYLSRFHDLTLLFDIPKDAKFRQSVAASDYPEKNTMNFDGGDDADKFLAYGLTKKVGSVDGLIGLFKANEIPRDGPGCPSPRFVDAVEQLPGTTPEQVADLKQALWPQNKQNQDQ